MDAIGVLDLAARDVLEPLVAIEAGLALAQLSDPRPDALRRRLDRYGMRPLPERVRHVVIARVRPRGVFEGRAPVRARAAQERRGEVEQHQRRARGARADVVPSTVHTLGATF